MDKVSEHNRQVMINTNDRDYIRYMMERSTPQISLGMWLPSHGLSSIYPKDKKEGKK